MALRLLTEGEFRASRYGSVADQIEGRLSNLIEQAESYIESQIDRVLSVEDYEESPEIGTVSLFLRQSPIVSVQEVTINGVPVDPAQYYVEKNMGIIELNSRPRGRVVVKYKAGYETIPPIIKTAVILQTALFAYQDFEMYGTGDGKPPGITYMQSDINKYIQRFKRKVLV